MQMSSENDNNSEIQRREKELEERERAIRLREMEAEIYKVEPPLYEPAKHEVPESFRQRWSKKLILAGKFSIIVVAVVAAVKIGTWLATAVIVGALSWVGYKLFFESDKPHK